LPSPLPWHLPVLAKQGSIGSPQSSQERRACSRGMSPPSECGQSPLRSLPQPAQSPCPRPAPQGTPAALSSPILRRLSSTSPSRAAPCYGPLRRAAAARGERLKRCAQEVSPARSAGGHARGAGAKRACILPIRRGAATPEVHMRDVRQALVVGVGMHGGHNAMPDGEGFVQHLRERCQAVRRTGGVGDQPVLPLEFLIVDPDDHHVIDGVVGRHGQQHALSPGGEVLFQFLPCGGSSAGRGRSVVPPYPPPRPNNRDATGNRWPSLPYRWCSPSASRPG
jgi:hypothetical protein